MGGDYEIRESLRRRIQYPNRADSWWQMRHDPVARMSQEDYIAILFDDLGFTGEQRRAWLKAEYGVKYPDELTKQGKHEVIEKLKVMKLDRAAAPAREEESGLLDFGE